MPKTLQLTLVTPQRQVFAETVEAVVLPGSDGSFGVLPGHIRLVAALAPGTLKYTQAGAEVLYAVGGGYAEIGNDQVTVLADTAELAEEIDLEAARRQRDQAIAQLRQGVRGAQLDAAEVSLRQALARLNVANLVRLRRPRPQ